MSALTHPGPGHPLFTDRHILLLTRNHLCVCRQGHPNNWRKHCKQRRQHGGINERLGASWELTARQDCERCDRGQHVRCRRLPHCFARERSPRGINKRQTGAPGGACIAAARARRRARLRASRRRASPFLTLFASLVPTERAAKRAAKLAAAVDELNNHPTKMTSRRQRQLLARVAKGEAAAVTAEMVAEGRRPSAWFELLDDEDEDEEEQEDLPEPLEHAPGAHDNNNSFDGGMGGGAAPITA